MSFSIFNKETKEEKFWKWFEKNQETYYSEIDNLEIREEIFNELTKNLKKVNEDLVFEFSPIHENKVREFTISAEGMKELFPIVEKLIEKAPKLKNWKFNAFRQRIPGDEFEIQYGDLKISYSDIYYRSENDNGKLGIELNIKNFDDEAQTQNAIYILLDGLIGEYDVTTKIGWIEWVKLNENEMENLKPIIELRNEIDK
ncbi:hypothetical protein G6N05_14945 [Flavobacterium sp. F372]|uniref:DUF695 domain-containing protein n=1 Tax=Flavobacterium bernardetii TaxID=2813823 RepID=A0ABR7J2J1_9FLAO|nr:hypothetical protein [Flavobacterium bernardetii]MBC5836172.1 hypothetical protein [Flavobacterium bernardetii]NHF71410.1 hypothetical protein [Flavobacterium bernardetii]